MMRFGEPANDESCAGILNTFNLEYGVLSVQVSSNSSMKPAIAESFMSALKDSTWPQHERLEQTSYFKSLKSCKLLIEHYLLHLTALRIMHRQLEVAFGDSIPESIRSIWSSHMCKTPSLDQDISHVQAAYDVRLSPAWKRRMSAYENDIQQSMCRHPFRSLGYLYVLEGSQIGGLIISRLLEDTFGIGIRSGSTYFSRHSQHVHAAWSTFKDQMNALDLSEFERSHAIDGAVACFEWMEKVFVLIQADG